MAKKKIMTVEDVLSKMYEGTKVVCVFYAYGCYYADTQRDGMITAEDCKEKMNVDCLMAEVIQIASSQDTVLIRAEIVH